LHYQNGIKTARKEILKRNKIDRNVSVLIACHYLPYMPVNLNVSEPYVCRFDFICCRYVHIVAKHVVMLLQLNTMKCYWPSLEIVHILFVHNEAFVCLTYKRMKIQLLRQTQNGLQV
jgi:hypothetical protein